MPDTVSSALRSIAWPDALKAFADYQLSNEQASLTVKTYREDLEHFRTWYLTEFETEPELEFLSTPELLKWKGHLVEVRRLRPASVNRRLSAVRSFLRWAEAEGFARQIRTPKSARKVRQPPKWLDRKERLAFDRAAARADKRDRAIATLLRHTGARVGELARATMRDIEISPRKGSIELHGKGSKDRTVPLNAEARAALVELGWPGKPDQRLVMGQRGPMGTEGIQLVIVAIAAAAKLAGCTCHTLRHTFCKSLAEAGVRLEQIAALAGHESLDTTRLYVEPGKDELAAAVERLAGAEE